MKTDYHRKMVERSLISTGNNYRMKKAMKKARKGEEVTIVYLGGSITIGKKEFGDRGYARASFNFFYKSFASNNNLRYINAGMNGASSIIGLIRLERDVLSFNPDIVFVEFSVNDSKDSIHRDIFESLIVRLLESESRPAVVLLFLQSESGYSCQGQMQVIGEHYKLPMISVRDAIGPEIEAGRMKWSDYADDNIHPNIAGNDLVAKFIAHYFETVADQREDEELMILQKPFYDISYKNMMLLDSKNFQPLSVMGFQKANTIKEFPNGWTRDRNVKDTHFKFRMKFKILFVVYKESKNLSEGSIMIRVDGNNAGIYSGYSTFGWNNPIAKLLYFDDVEKEHLVEITMAPGDEMKDFNLLAFGYC